MKLIFTLFLLFLMQSTFAQTLTDTGKVYTFVEEQPCFLDSVTNDCSMSTLFRELFKAISVKEAMRTGTGDCCNARVSFIVEKDGGLSNFEIEKNQAGDIGEQAVAFLKQARKWKPGKQNGQLVRVKFTLPVKIKVS